LTGLPLGGAKGGSDFDPKGKSDAEVLRFCQSFMNSLHHYIGPNRDVPAGDIGVGGREIGYMFGQYKRLKNQFEGAITGKDVKWGGSEIRVEATGYGLVYFVQEMIKDVRGESLAGKVVSISGSGNVALYCALKLIALGVKVVTLSDSHGYIYEEGGFTSQQILGMIHLKEIERGRVSEYLKLSPTAKFEANKRPWNVKCDIALPCACENEIDEEDAINLVKNGCFAVGEGANMPSTQAAIEVYYKNNILFAPAKAANAGGVACSGLEMSQNSIRTNWTPQEVDAKLHIIMINIYHTAKKTADEFGHKNNLLVGANIAGFLKVAKSMVQQGY